MKQEDVILECMVVKGPGLDFLGVVYQEQGKRLRGLSRRSFPNAPALLQYYPGTTRQELSARLLEEAYRLAQIYGLVPIHLIYPEGIEEGRFILDLRQARHEWLLRQQGRQN